jgi:hypothetical protein
VANKGIGIYDCLNTTCKLVMAQFIEEHHMPTVQVPEAQNLAVKSS